MNAQNTARYDRLSTVGTAILRFQDLVTGTLDACDGI
jgi:hypothetical protein